MKNVRLKNKFSISGGYTLIELIVSMGLFAIIMLLASGAYLMMIDMNRQAQGIVTGIDNLSFALETMARDIRTGTNYICPSSTDSCVIDGSVNSFSFTNEKDVVGVQYSLSGSAIQRTIGGANTPLTDPVSVTISSLMFYVVHTKTLKNGGSGQPHVTLIVTGTVAAGPRNPAKSFTIETGATMRGSNI